MSEEATANTTEAGGGFFGNLFDLYFSPGEAFVRILRRPSFWLPLVGLMVMSLGFIALWLPKVDVAQFSQMQMEEAGRWDKMTPEQRDQALSMQTKIFPIIAWAIGFLGAPISLLIVGATLLFVFRFFYAGEVTFRQSLTITAYSSLAISIIATPLRLLTLMLKGDWNVDPNTALNANLSILLDKQAVPKALFALATSLDLFSFWLIFLLASGYAVATRRSTGSAATGILVIWGILVAIKVGFAAFFGR